MLPLEKIYAKTKGFFIYIYISFILVEFVQNMIPGYDLFMIFALIPHILIVLRKKSYPNEELLLNFNFSNVVVLFLLSK